MKHLGCAWRGTTGGESLPASQLCTSSKPVVCNENCLLCLASLFLPCLSFVGGGCSRVKKCKMCSAAQAKQKGALTDPVS